MSFIVSKEPASQSTVTYPMLPIMPHDSADNWATINPVVVKGLIVYEDDDALNPLYKLGDGVTAYNDLPYLHVATRKTEIASSATPTPNADTTDRFMITALAVNTTIGAPTGSPADGRALIIRIKDNGTIRTITWNAIYRAIGITLPTATVAGKTLYIGMFYNAADSKWDVTAYGIQA